MTPQARVPLALELKQVSKRFGRVEALRDVNLQVPVGSVYALWGPNGAGKSTLLKCVLGMMRFQGEILVHGLPVSQAGSAVRRRTGYVPQEIPRFELTAGQLIDLVSRIRRANAAPALLDTLELAPHLNKELRQLSGGLKQRLALYLALLGEPDLLLLDEPTANLDRGARSELLQLLQSLRAQRSFTIVFASHRPDDVESLADTVVLMEDGRIVAVESAGRSPQVPVGAPACAREGRLP